MNKNDGAIENAYATADAIRTNQDYDFVFGDGAVRKSLRDDTLWGKTTRERGLFERLMGIYEDILPSWKSTYFEHERHLQMNNNLPKEGGTIASPKYSMENFIQEAKNYPKMFGDDEQQQDELIDIRMLALCTFFYNKIAHECEDALKRCVRESVKGKSVTEKDFKDICFGIRNIVEAQDSLNNATTKISASKASSDLHDQYNKLGNFGFTQGDINTIIKNGGLDSICLCRRDAFRRKSESETFLIDRIDKYEKQYGQLISYGFTKDIDGAHIFAIDLPFYGQFSIHSFQAIHVIGANKKYPYQVYNAEDGLVFLTQGDIPQMPGCLTLNSHIKEYLQDQNFEIDTNITFDSLAKEMLAGISDVKVLHEIAVKIGFTSDQIEILHKEYDKKQNLQKAKATPKKVKTKKDNSKKGDSVGE